MAKKRKPKGYFGNTVWAFNSKVRNTLVAWMRKLRVRIWIIAPLAAVAFGVNDDPRWVAIIALAIVGFSVVIQLIVDSATDKDENPSNPELGDSPDAGKNEKKE